MVGDEQCKECGNLVTSHRTWCRHAPQPVWEGRDRTLNKVAVAVYRAIVCNLQADDEGLRTAVSEAAIMLAEVASSL